MNDPAVLAQNALRGRILSALRKGVLAAVDLGDSKVACAIARVDLARQSMAGDRDADAYSALKVVGGASVPTEGMRGGEVEQPELVARAIRRAVDAAQEGAGVEIDSAILALPAGAPRTLSAEADTAIPADPVDDATVARLMAACRPELAPRLRRPLLVEPTRFVVDGERETRDPRGKPARSLKMVLSILTVDREALAAAVRAASLAGLGVDGVVPASLASALACLTEDEFDLGAVCIDLGAAVTGHASFRYGRFTGADVVPLGGQRITVDIAEALGIDLPEAERMKVQAGGPIAADPAILGSADGGSETSTVLVGVVRPRLEEIFELIRGRLAADEPRPVVLTGGASQLPGAVEVARATLGRRVRLGRSIRVAGTAPDASGPEFSTVFGCLAHATRCARDPWAQAIKNACEAEDRFVGVRDWFRRNW